MIKIWKKQRGNGEKVGVIFMEFSKGFDTISCTLLSTKAKAYCFPDQALSLLQS